MQDPKGGPPASGRAKSSGVFSRRKLTSFLCQEMLYDFMLGTLDADRTAAVEAFLLTDSDCRASLEHIKLGIQYSENLRKIELSPELLGSLKDSENALTIGKKYTSPGQWPIELKWSLTFILVSACTAGLVGIIPWSKLSALHPKDAASIELAKVPRPTEATVEVAQEHQEGDTTTEPEGSGDEEGDDSSDGKAQAVAATTVASTGATPVATPGANSARGVVVAKVDNVQPPPESAPRPPVPPLGEPVKPPPAAASKLDAARAGGSGGASGGISGGTSGQSAGANSNSPADEKDGANGELSETGKNKARGFVFRAFMTLANLEEIGPQIADAVVELGGKKAGEVELGWKRGTGRYFHFVLPETNQEKLMEKLRAYGPVRISKDPHPRVMPEGQLRFILWIESPNGSSSPSKSE